MRGKRKRDEEGEGFANGAYSYTPVYKYIYMYIDRGIKRDRNTKICRENCKVTPTLSHMSQKPPTQTCGPQTSPKVLDATTQRCPALGR